MSVYDKYEKTIEAIDPIKYRGKVKEVIGFLIKGKGPHAQIGEICKIFKDKENSNEFNDYIKVEVVGFNEKEMMLMPLSEMVGVEPNQVIIATGEPLSIPVSDRLLGRVLNGMGEPIDTKGEIYSSVRYPIFNNAPTSLSRRRITERLSVGIKAIDIPLTLGKGQRIGIFSGSGVGKSTLLGMIAHYTEADVNVICLIGERGREVKEFIEDILQEDGLKRSVVVVATSDASPLERVRSIYVAQTIAEYFRDEGKDVLLMVDSMTRFAWAQREIGLSIGEPPATRGYPTSVFTLLPKIFERAGCSDKGSITGIYTVLVEGDDVNEPISDTVRGVLDGHIILSRSIAEKGQYPSIDILRSISRLYSNIASKEQKELVKKLRNVIATYTENEDLISIGAYSRGTNPDIDYAIDKIKAIQSFLSQEVSEGYSFEESMRLLSQIFESKTSEEEPGYI
jgi:flagellum-specific ATP synthase